MAIECWIKAEKVKSKGKLGDASAFFIFFIESISRMSEK
jgi:hypothetical protein